LVDGETLILVESHLRKGLVRLRIAAPGTAQMASLQENNCPDPRTVVERIFLDIEDYA